MKEETLAILCDMIAGIIIVIIIGCIILFFPYQEAFHRDSLEKVIIDDYLEDQTLPAWQPSGDSLQDFQPVTSLPAEKNGASSSTLSPNYKGEIDCILVIDKIDLRKAIIRGPYNDYNLNRYLFVTADQTSTLGIDNYVIYGHCSQTYGHSFNRLEELEVGDTFQLIQGNATYEYVVTNIQRELRENAAPLLSTGTNTVQLVSCEKKIAKGFSEKRLIIVTAEKSL